MISVSHKATTNTTMLPDGERLLYALTALGAILRRECSRNFPYSSASVFSFADEYQKKGSPRRITDRLRQMMVFDESLDIQILNCYLIKLSDKLIARLVKEIEALIRNLQMFLREQASGFPAILTAALFLAHLALLNLQLALCLAKIFGILNYLASRKRGIVFDSNVDAHTFTCAWDERRMRFFDSEDDKPSVDLFLQCASLDLAFNLSAQPNAARADFRERQFITFKLEACLRVREAIIAMLALEAWKANPLPFTAVCRCMNRLNTSGAQHSH